MHSTSLIASLGLAGCLALSAIGAHAGSPVEPVRALPILAQLEAGEAKRAEPSVLDAIDELARASGLRICLSAPLERHLAKIPSGLRGRTEIPAEQVWPFVESVLLRHGLVVAELHPAEPRLLGVFSEQLDEQGSPPLRDVEIGDLAGLADHPAFLVRLVVPFEARGAREAVEALRLLGGGRPFERACASPDGTLLILQGAALHVTGRMRALQRLGMVGEVPGIEPAGQPAFEPQRSALQVPLSALEAARRVIAVVEEGPGEAAGAEIRRLASSYRRGRGGQPDRIDVVLDLVVRAESTIAATADYESMRARLLESSWCMELSNPRTLAHVSGDFVVIDRLRIEVSLAPGGIVSPEAEILSYPESSIRALALGGESRIGEVDLSPRVDPLGANLVDHMIRIRTAEEDASFSRSRILTFLSALESDLPGAGVVSSIKLEPATRARAEAPLPDLFCFEATVTVRSRME